MSAEIWAELKPKQLLIETTLREYLQESLVEAPEPLAQAMSYSLLAPAKRLRPTLCLLACEAVGGDATAALPAACALEMIHTYSLIHDDLPAMDNDDLRRGLPTCHKKFGEALGILAGDALLTLAFEVVASRCPPRTATVSVLELARGAGAVGMVAGQTLDLQAEERIPGKLGEATIRTLPHLESIHRLKTGALFRSSLRLGLFAAQAETAAGVNAETLNTLDRYSSAFGLLFQVTDDLLDVESTSEKTGKRVGKDADRGKLTYPSLIGLPASRLRAEELAREAMAAAELLGPGAAPLMRLASFVASRDR